MAKSNLKIKYGEVVSNKRKRKPTNILQTKLQPKEFIWVDVPGKNYKLQLDARLTASEIKEKINHHLFIMS
jgi:hypothetical protein